MRNSGFIAASRTGGYSAARRTRGAAVRFHLKPTGPGRYLLYGQDRRLVGVRGRTGVRTAGNPSRLTEWVPNRVSRRAFSISTTATRGQLAVDGSGDLVLADTRVRGRRRAFSFVASRGCRGYPEATVGARGRRFKGATRRGRVFGFVDAHLHITANLRAGGRVIHGDSFDRFGIVRALEGDESDHGPRGALDVIGNLLRSGSPSGTHDTHGWPTFAGWPVHDTYTHQQIYYVWLKRAWMSGERLVVAQTVEDEPLCRALPLRAHSCDESRTIRLEVRRLRALQSYVDAQSGGRGRGWFRLVYTPNQARRTIRRGKLAVVIGVESSNPLGCSEYRGKPQCTRGEVDRGIRRFRLWGVRSLFVAHWVDNAFAGAALEGGAQGLLLNVLNAFQTGHFFRTEPAPSPGRARRWR